MSAMRRLSPDNVVTRPLEQRVVIVTSAAVWTSGRHHPIGEEAVMWM